jgi:ABC-type arginine transport system permease subunit
MNGLPRPSRCVIPVARYLFSAEILRGVLVTIELTASAMCIGIALGITAALMKLSEEVQYQRACGRRRITSHQD